MKMTTRLLVPVLAALLLAGCYESEQRVSETVEKSWPASELKVLDLEGVNGSITITAGDDAEIHLVADVRSTHDRKASEILSFDEVGDTLKIREHHRRNRPFPFFIFGGSGVRIDYEIRVPASTELDVSTTNGRVEISGVRGEHTLRSVNGRIEVTTPDAELSATTVNGRIIAKFTETFRGARLRTVNGSVRVMVPPDTAMSADVDTVNGSFTSNIPVHVGSDHNASAREYPLDVTTVNGSVSVSEIGRDGA